MEFEDLIAEVVVMLEDLKSANTDFLDEWIDRMIEHVQEAEES